MIEMLAYKNRKRLEDTLTEYVCKWYGADNDDFSTEDMRIAVDLLKTLWRSARTSPWTRMSRTRGSSRHFTR